MGGQAQLQEQTNKQQQREEDLFRGSGSRILGYYLDTRGPLVSRLFLTFGTDVMGQSSLPSAPCFIERSSLADCFAFVCTVQRLRHLSTLRRLGMGMHRVARVGGPTPRTGLQLLSISPGKRVSSLQPPIINCCVKEKQKPKNKWN